MKRKIITNKAAAERAAVIRRQNVQRHQKAAAVSKLRDEIQRHTANHPLPLFIFYLYKGVFGQIQIEVRAPEFA